MISLVYQWDKLVIKTYNPNIIILLKCVEIEILNINKCIFNILY